MKKQRFKETQIVSILKQYEGGREAIDVCRENSISKATLYNWRKRYSGMNPPTLRSLLSLLHADLMLHNDILKKTQQYLG